MAFGKIRRWNARKSGADSIWRFRRWGVIFFHDFHKPVSAFRRWLLRESLFESQNVAVGQTPVAVRIVER